jgi:hypothetical protein
MLSRIFAAAMFTLLGAAAPGEAHPMDCWSFRQRHPHQFGEGPEVRIRLPPAVSRVRTRPGGRALTVTLLSANLLAADDGVERALL